jgi:hypothetical protein
VRLQGLLIYIVVKSCSKPYLSCDSLITIQNALDHISKALEMVHWNGVVYGATEPFYQNLKSQQLKIVTARTELAEIYTAQFPKS